MLRDYIDKSEIVTELMLKVSEMIGWETTFHLEMTVLVVSLAIGFSIEVVLKVIGAYLAYTRFGSDMEASFWGVILFHSGGKIAIFTFIPICLILSALVDVMPPIGTIHFGFPDADYGRTY